MESFLKEIEFKNVKSNIDVFPKVETFPLEKPSFEDSMEDFFELRRNSFVDLLKKGKWGTRYDGKHLKKLNYYIDINRTGLKSSNFFHFENRMSCNSINSPSPIRNWYNKKFKRTLMNSKFAKDNVKTALALRKYIPSQFRPSAAKCLFEMFDIKNYHDPCMGWGDRLCAALATKQICNISGTEVNPHLFFGYEQQIEKFCQDEHKATNFSFERAEVFVPNYTYDFAFTSPPYFNIEKYEGMWQSIAKYKKLKDWLNKFLFRMFENVFSGLEKGGHFLVNISDVYSNHTINELCKPLINFSESIDSCEFLGSIGYRMQKRVNSKSNIDGIFAEPILMFRKKYD